MSALTFRILTDGLPHGLADLHGDILLNGRRRKIALTADAHMKVFTLVDVGVVGEDFEFSRALVKGTHDVVIGLMVSLSKRACHAAI